VACCQFQYFIAIKWDTGENCVVADNERANSLLDEGREGRLEIETPCFRNNDFPSKRAPCRKYLAAPFLLSRGRITFTNVVDARPWPAKAGLYFGRTSARLRLV
jgi:hypothetical protein